MVFISICVCKVVARKSTGGRRQCDSEGTAWADTVGGLGAEAKKSELPGMEAVRMLSKVKAQSPLELSAEGDSGPLGRQKNSKKIKQNILLASRNLRDLTLC